MTGITQDDFESAGIIFPNDFLSFKDWAQGLMVSSCACNNINNPYALEFMVASVPGRGKRSASF